MDKKPHVYCMKYGFSGMAVYVIDESHKVLGETLNTMTKERKNGLFVKGTYFNLEEHVIGLLRLLDYERFENYAKDFAEVFLLTKRKNPMPIEGEQGSLYKILLEGKDLLENQNTFGVFPRKVNPDIRPFGEAVLGFYLGYEWGYLVLSNINFASRLDMCAKPLKACKEVNSINIPNIP